MTGTASVFAAAALAIVAPSAVAVSADPAAAEADGIIKAVWDAYLTRCGTSAFEVLDGRVVLELDQAQFHLAPTKLQAAAKQNGYQYQATAIASARRWRWAPLGKALKWSPWQDGQTLTVRLDQFGGDRGQTTVQNAVLQFDLVRKDDGWTANQPLSPLNSDYRPFDPIAAMPKLAAPACEMLAGK